MTGSFTFPRSRIMAFLEQPGGEWRTYPQTPLLNEHLNSVYGPSYLPTGHHHLPPGVIRVVDAASSFGSRANISEQPPLPDGTVS